MKAAYRHWLVIVLVLSAIPCWSRPLVDSEYTYVSIEQPDRALRFTTSRTSLYDGHGLSIDLRPCAVGIEAVCVESPDFAVAVPNLSTGERKVTVGSFACRAIGDYGRDERMTTPPPVIFAECQSSKRRLTFWFSPARGLLGFINVQGAAKAVWVLSGECGLGASKACSE